MPKGASVAHQGRQFVGDGSWTRCQQLQAELFERSDCSYSSCSFGGEYQPSLPAKFYGFSYLYDRVAAIGLLDGAPRTFGSQTARVVDLERAGEGLCALGQTQIDERFRAHPDASKAAHFCGDVAYVTTLLRSLGFGEEASLTMTNRIKVLRYI